MHLDFILLVIQLPPYSQLSIRKSKHYWELDFTIIAFEQAETYWSLIIYTEKTASICPHV